MSTELLQLYSQQWWLADGSQTVWNFSFSDGYLSRDYVKAYSIDPDDVTTEIVVDDAMFTGEFQLTIDSPAVPVGHTLVIYRDTPKTGPLVNFVDGARVSETSLDTIARQAIHVAAEVLDGSGGFITDQLGFKNMKQVPYTGASVVSDADSGRCHYKTDHTGVTVPDTLDVTFLSTIVNDSASPMSITFDDALAIMQGSDDFTGAATWTLAPRNTLSIYHPANGRWFISGYATAS